MSCKLRVRQGMNVQDGNPTPKKHFIGGWVRDLPRTNTQRNNFIRLRARAT